MSLNRITDFRLGTVGKPLAENDIRISADGEILVKGPGVFLGYTGDQNNPATFTLDGYYKTGDLGEFDCDGYLKINGRKSDMIKTSTGRWISPLEIETVYRQIPSIDQFLVIGNGRKGLIGLAVLKGKSDGAQSDVLQEQVMALGQELSAYQRPQCLIILSQAFGIETGDLTLSLKLRRAAIEKKYKELLDVAEQLSKSSDRIMIMTEDELHRQVQPNIIER